MFSISKFAKSRQLPTLPEVALKLIEIAKQEDPDYREVSSIVRSDPVIAGKILKTANSALFGFRQRVETIEQAIPKLGITLLRTLILSFHLADHKSHKEELDPVYQLIWRSSLTQAVLAELMAEKIETADPPSCFLAAMMQDIGILTMVSEAPNEYLNVVLKRAEIPNVVTAERCEFGFSHVDVSIEIMKLWGFDEGFTEPIRRHHDHVIVETSQNDGALASILQAASLGATMLFSTRTSPNTLDSSLTQWTRFMDSHVGLSASQAEEIISEVKLRVGEYSAMFKFDLVESVQSERVIAEAKTMLQEIALKNQLEMVSLQKNKRMPKDEDNELYLDSLTKLFNRRYMDDNLNDCLAKHIKKQEPLAFMFLDVDKFKEINDSHGHAIGDKAIEHVAKWIKQSIRKDDLAIRFGGDEFLVIFQSTKEDQSRTIAERIAKSIPPMKLDDETHIIVSLSAGCATYLPVEGDTADANWLIDEADQTMYVAKKSGGNSVSFQSFVGQRKAG